MSAGACLARSQAWIEAWIHPATALSLLYSTQSIVGRILSVPLHCRLLQKQKILSSQSNFKFSPHSIRHPFFSQWRGQNQGISYRFWRNTSFVNGLKLEPQYLQSCDVLPEICRPNFEEKNISFQNTALCCPIPAQESLQPSPLRSAGNMSHAHSRKGAESIALAILTFRRSQ